MSIYNTPLEERFSEKLEELREGKNMTREQLATILLRYSRKQAMASSKRASLSGFADAGSVSAYAEEAMRWAVAEGILNGSDGKLLPQDSATRAQVAAVLVRFLQA